MQTKHMLWSYNSSAFIPTISTKAQISLKTQCYLRIARYQLLFKEFDMFSPKIIEKVGIYASMSFISASIFAFFFLSFSHDQAFNAETCKGSEFHFSQKTEFNSNSPSKSANTVVRFCSTVVTRAGIVLVLTCQKPQAWKTKPAGEKIPDSYHLMEGGKTGR